MPKAEKRTPAQRRALIFAIVVAGLFVLSGLAVLLSTASK